MTDTTKTEALRLAEAIDPFTRPQAPDHLTVKVAAAELRRLSAERDRLAADLEKERKARQDAQRQRADDYARLMADAKMEQRGRGRAEAECARLAAECEALRADAERYRELRRQHEGDAVYALTVFGPDGDEGLAPIGSLPGELDAAIDAARAKQ